MIHIGVDAHNLEGNRTGVGRYLENLLREFALVPDIEHKIHFTLYFKKEVPKDDFLKHPLFELHSLKVKFRSSFMVYFLSLLPFNAWRDGVGMMWFPTYMVPYTWRGRSIVVLHDILFERYPDAVPLRYRVPYRLFGKYGAHHSDTILTVSEFSKKEIQEVYGVPSSKIVVTPLGVDPSMRVIENKDALRVVKEKYGIKKDFILHVGQIFNRRHVDAAMKAFAHIAADIPNVQFLVVGANRTEPFIDIDGLARDLNDSMGREGIVRSAFVPDEDLVLLYNAAQVGVYLSDYEGFGLPPLEMLACGTPVLAPDTTSLETTLQGHQVVVNNPSDVQEIAEKLRAILQDEDYLRRMKTEGPRYASQFTWKKCAAATLEAFGIQSENKRTMNSEQ